MNEALNCLSPAKINLFLHVVGRRDDGYHLLQTAFRLLDYGDRIQLRCRPDGRINRLAALTGVTEEQDLTVRAARLLQEKTGCKLGVDIAVTKRLPMGGGLGGGSSNAATVLLALNKLWRLHLTRAQLQAWGLTLGADVPVFIYGQDAFAQGVGEVLQAFELPRQWYVVVQPPVAVSTAEIFAAECLTRDTKSVTMPGFVAAYTSSAPGANPGLLGNDLQAETCRRYPQVADALEVLNAAAQSLAMASRACMSGSGACVFLQCADEAQAQQVVAALPEGSSAWAAPSLLRHPLYAYAS